MVLYFSEASEEEHGDNNLPPDHRDVSHRKENHFTRGATDWYSSFSFLGKDQLSAKQSAADPKAWKHTSQKIAAPTQNVNMEVSR